MGSTIRWGILGPGTIAWKFATGLQALADASLVAVGSRSLERAQAFGDDFAVPRCYGSYQELVQDPDVDVIYVATPHPLHKEHTMLALQAGKGVLCEKPMSINSADEAEMIACARQTKQFLMEAHWTRFLPAIRQAQQWIADGAIGEVRLLQADFGFRAGWNPAGRLFDPHLGGGALLDVGVYTLSLASLLFPGSPSHVQSAAHLGQTGVDEQAGIVLRYDEGQLAVLSCAIRTSTPHDAHIYGTEGSIHIPGFWHAESAELRRNGESEVVELPFVGNGYNYEAAEVMDCLREGKLESDMMPLDESLRIMQTADTLRRQWGLVYPTEEGRE